MFIPQFEDLGVYKNDCFLSSRDCLRSLSYPWISWFLPSQSASHKPTILCHSFVSNIKKSTANLSKSSMCPNKEGYLESGATTLAAVDTETTLYFLLPHPRLCLYGRHCNTM